MPTSNIPAQANPEGSYVLDNVMEIIREHWRNGRQIVPLLGAGISVESGVPAIPALREHLLALYVLQKRKLYWKGKDAGVPAYTLERDDWVSPSRLSEHLSRSSKENIIREFLKDEYKDRLFKHPPFQVKDSDGQKLKKLTEKMLATASGKDLIDFAQTLGLNWLGLMEEIAFHRPELVDTVFDALGARTTPGPTHNLLTHCVNWFNIRLLLTTNFDNMVERSLSIEGMDPYTYDIHMQAPPPPRVLVERHLSVIKLHGSHYGLRADRSVDQPLDKGHMTTLLDYLDDDVILLCLGYGGSEQRITGFIKEVVKEKKNSCIIRVDPMNPSWEDHFFRKLQQDNDSDKTGHQERPRIVNLYYPPSASLFLLHLYQYVANRLPNTRGRYPAAPHTAAPHKTIPSLGRDAKWILDAYAVTSAKPTPSANKRELADKSKQIIERLNLTSTNWAVVSGTGPCGISQALAQVYEHYFQSHQILWCDLDEATSVGTVLGWLRDFTNSRQPELPSTPLPLPLPDFNSVGQISKEEVKELDRVVRSLWSRLSREKIVIILDSLSCAVGFLGKTDKSIRCQREAARLLVLVALLSKYAQKDKKGQCILLVGTHQQRNDELKNLKNAFLSDLFKLEDSELSDVAKITECIDDLIGKTDVSFDEKEVLNIGNLEKQSSDPVAFFSAIASHTDYRPIVGNSIDYPLQDWVWNLTRYERLWRNDDENFLQEVSKLEAVLLGFLQKFILECSLSNRPRSWRELLHLPSVKALSEMIDLEDSTPSLLSLAIQQQEELIKDENFKSYIVTDLIYKSATHLTSLSTLDKRSRALHILINGAIRRKLLFLQPGGFYYMDGSCRSTLREIVTLHPELISYSATPDKEGLKETHERLAKFFERNYNQSGDVTALNHYFFQIFSVLAIQKKSGQVADYWKTIENCLARLLENSIPARGSLYAYDHCFLLLQIMDEGEEYYRELAVENHRDNIDPKSYIHFQKRILHALCEVYEDNVDSESGIACSTKLIEIVAEINEVRLEGRVRRAKRAGTIQRETDTANSSYIAQRSKGNRLIDNYDIAFAYHRQQKAYWQQMAATESCCAAYHALVFLLNEENEAKAMVITDANIELADVLSKIRDCLGVSNTADYEGSAKVMSNGYLKLSPTPHRTLYHRIILRLIRTLIRVYKFSTLNSDEAIDKAHREDARRMCEVFLRFGDDLNLGDTPSPTTIKLLTARYNSARGLLALYGIGETTRQKVNLKMTFYNHQAQSRAMRSEGAQSSVYEANTLIDEAEMLLWNARVNLNSALQVGSTKDLEIAYADASARQAAAVRHFEVARTHLSRGSISMAAWRELTVLRLAATADILKRITCQYIGLVQTDEDYQKTELKIFSQFCYHAEQAAFELGHMLPLLWNDSWRGGRAAIQLFRIAGYICRMIWQVTRTLNSQHKVEPSHLPTHLSSLNALIRAINNFDLGRNNLPTVPLEPNAEFEVRLWKDIADWVFKIDGWLERILGKDTDKQRWKEFEISKKRFEDDRKRYKDSILCFTLLKKIAKEKNLNSPLTIDSLFDEFARTEKEWQTSVRKWPDVYGSPRDNSTKPGLA